MALFAPPVARSDAQEAPTAHVESAHVLAAERVALWRALTTAEGVRAWAGEDATMTLEFGGAVRLPALRVGASAPFGSARVLGFVPERSLSVGAGERTLTVQLEEAGPRGACRTHVRAAATWPAGGERAAEAALDALFERLEDGALPAHDAHPVLKRLAFLVGGRWFGEGAMADGRVLEPQIEFEWRLGGRMLHSSTYERVDPTSEERHVAYEADFFWHPGRDEVLFFDVGRDGAVHDGVARLGDPLVEVVYTRFERGRFFDCRDTFERLDRDDVRWQSFLRYEGEWHPVLTCELRRPH